MIKLRIKHIVGIIIILIILYFIYKKIKQVETFFDYPSPITTGDTDKINEGEHMGLVILEFIYKEAPECSITRQFLSGCCEPIKNVNFTGDYINSDNSKILIKKESSYMSSYEPTEKPKYQVNNTPENPTVKYEHVNLGTTPTPTTVYKGMEYKEGNTCNPITYYADNICNLSKESTLYHLKKIIADLNKKFNKKIYDVLPTVFGTYQDEYSSAITYVDIEKEGSYPLNISELAKLKELYHFHLELKLTVDTTGKENSYPKLKLKIPERMKKEEVEYQAVDYTNNINNIDQIMEFLYQNLVINVNVTDTNKLTLFDKYYRDYEYDSTRRDRHESNKMKLYHNKRIFTFEKKATSKLTNTTDPSQDNLTPNFIRKFYLTQTLSSEAPINIPPQIHFVHEEPGLREYEMKNSASSEEENYMTTRPLLYWDNIPALDDKKQDYSHLVIILRDANLTEYYFDNDKPHNLIYWFAWNVSKHDLSIFKKTLADIKSNPQDDFSQLYPYQLFAKFDSQFYIEDEYKNSGGYFKDAGALHRFLRLKVDIIPVTKENSKSLQNIYDKHQNKNFFDKGLFYQEFFKHLINIDSDSLTYPESSINPCPSPECSPGKDNSFSVPYRIPESEATKKMDKYFKSEFKDETLTLFNYGDIVYDLQRDKEKIINLPYHTYYEIIIINENIFDEYISPGISTEKIHHGRFGPSSLEMELMSKDYSSEDHTIKLTVDEIESCPVFDGSFTYRIPYKTDIIKIKSSLDKKIIVRPSPYITRKLIWRNIIKEKDKGTPNYNIIDDTTILIINNTKHFTLNFSKNSKFHLLFKCDRILQLADPKATKDYDLEYNEISVDASTTKNYYISIYSKTKSKTHKIEFNNLKGSKLTNGIITFLPDNFNLKQNKVNNLLQQYHFGAQRIKANDLEYKYNCSEDNKKLPTHQILPTLSWNKSIGLTNNKNNLFYAVEAYYLVKNDEGKEEKNIVYLEWDIPLTNTSTSYEIFKNYKYSVEEIDTTTDIKYATSQRTISNSDMEIRDYPITSAPSPKFNYIDYAEGTLVDINGKTCKERDLILGNPANITLSLDKYQYIEPTNYNLDTANSQLLSPAISEEYEFKDRSSFFNKLQEAKLNSKAIEIIDGKVNIRHNVRGKKINDMRDLNFIKDIENKYKYTSTKPYICEYNLNLNIWQLWFQETDDVKTWLANQEKESPIFGVESSWLFSPDFHSEIYSGRYDFFDFPNQFNPDKKIGPHVMDLTPKIKLTFNDESKTNPIYDCAHDISNRTVKETYTTSAPATTICENLDANNFNLAYFRSTLFNLPDISETDSQGKLKYIDKEKISVSKENGDLYYELPIRAQIYVYETTEDRSDARVLSDSLRKHYINSSLSANIQKSLNEKIDSFGLTCSENAKKLMYNELLDEILKQKGDLSKVPFRDIIKNISGLNLDKYNSLNQIPNVFRNKNVINVNQEIKLDSPIYENFQTYTQNRIMHKNYYSYGDINLQQNETLMSFKVPLNIDCLRVKKNDFNRMENDPLNKLIIFQSNFIKNTTVIKIHYDKFSHGSIIDGVTAPINDYFKNIEGKLTYIVKEYWSYKFDDSEINMKSNEIETYLNKIKALEDINYGGLTPGPSHTHRHEHLPPISAEDIADDPFPAPTDKFEHSHLHEDPHHLPVMIKFDLNHKKDKIDELVGSINNILDLNFTSFNFEEFKYVNTEEYYKFVTEQYGFKGENTVDDKIIQYNTQLGEGTEKALHIKFLKIHKQVVSIMYFYQVLQDLFLISDKDSNFHIDKLKTYITEINKDTSGKKDEEKEQINRLLDSLNAINIKLASYNEFVSDIYYKICNVTLKPKPKVIKSTLPSPIEQNANKFNIINYYKDMIFSIFDKE